METAILVVAGFVALGASILICMLLKMIVTGDYSLLIGQESQEVQRLHSHELAARAREYWTNSVPNSAHLDQRLAVAHFAQELPELKGDDERADHANDLVGIRKRRQEK